MQGTTHRCRAALAAAFRPAALAAVVLFVAGCGSDYMLRGRVVRGEITTIAFVPADDARLAGEGVAGAQIALYRDPQSLGRELTATGVSGDDGTVVIPVPAFGAGWMDEDWLIQVERYGGGTDQLIRLPRQSSGLRLLITMSAGGGSLPRSEPSPIEEFERFK